MYGLHQTTSIQPTFWAETSEEDPEYLARQLITYIGNKRSLLGLIGRAVERVKARLAKDRLRCFDAFSGSGVVSRFMKAHSSFLVSNDLEGYAAVAGRCYLMNRSKVHIPELRSIVEQMNHRVEADEIPTGFIEEMYAPKNEQRITKEDRVFYSKSNARRLDRYRQLIDTYPTSYRDLLLGPLIGRASVHANTAGVFKGFYKNRDTKVGQFGGTGSDALVRILGQITMDIPVFSRFECDYEVHQEDANQLASRLRGLDMAYVDPPYNQHPYGSNYFMLNLLVDYRRPSNVSQVSGIPTDWQRSGYNVRAQSPELLRQLLENIDAPFVLISFNNEGFISPSEMQSILSKLGDVETFETQYNAFRGSRSFENRPIHVTEQLFLLSKR